MHFLPRNTIDASNREVDRAIRLTKNGNAYDCEHIVFRLPSKSGDFP